MLSIDCDPQRMGRELTVRVSPEFRRDCARAAVLSPAICTFRSVIFHGDGGMTR